MRLYPPAFVVARRAVRDVTLSGHKVAKNELCVVNIVGMHRRPDLFADPERFDPERFLPENEGRISKQAFLPFGAGPRICIGNHFALLEGQLAIAALAQRVRLDRPEGAAPVVTEPLITLRPKGGMPMRVTWRQRARERVGWTANPAQPRRVSTHLLVGNPTAQSGRNQERIDRALGLLRAARLEARLLPTLPRGGTVRAVREALEADPAIRVVVAMGGDGTFREVAAGLFTSAAKQRVALGMLPTGTANDQGKSFGLEASAEALERNVEVIARGHETALDVGVYRAAAAGADPDYFFDSAGWGLSARVLAQRNKDRALVETLGPLKELYRDHAVYAGAFLRTFLESYVVEDELRVEAVLDGRLVELDGLTDLVVKNTRVYAGAWVLDPTSRSDDGAFELVPFRGKVDWASKAVVDLDGNPVTEAMLDEIGVEHSKPLRARAAGMELTIHATPTGGAPLRRAARRGRVAGEL